MSNIRVFCSAVLDYIELWARMVDEVFVKDVPLVANVEL